MKKVDTKIEKFTEIYNDYYSLLFCKIYAQVGNVDESEDICHDLFMKFYLNYDKINNGAAWLLSTVNYAIIDYYRMNNKQKCDTDLTSSQESSDFDDDRHDTYLIIEEALENMDNYKDDMHRIIFELIALYDFSYKETAQQLGLSKHQIKYRYCITLKKIEDYLRKKGIKNLDDLF